MCCRRLRSLRPMWSRKWCPSSICTLKILACGLINAAVLVPVYALIRRLHRWDVISAPIFRFHGKKW